MNMIILSKENVDNLKKINEKNVHLNRALQPIPLKDGSFAVVGDILEDQGTWSNWIALLSKMPQREVLAQEFEAPDSLL